MTSFINLQYKSYETCNEMAVAVVTDDMETPPEMTLQSTEMVLLNNG